MKIRVFILSLTGLITTAAFGQEPGLPARLGMIGSAWRSDCRRLPR